MIESIYYERVIYNKKSCQKNMPTDQEQEPRFCHYRYRIPELSTVGVKLPSPDLSVLFFECFKQLSIRSLQTMDWAVILARKTVDAQDDMIASLGSKSPYIHDFIARYCTWYAATESKFSDQTGRIRRRSYEISRVINPEILQLFDQIQPGQKEAWEEVLNEVLKGVQTEAPLMFTGGFLNGFSLAVLQEGEKLFRSRGVPYPIFFTYGGFSVINLMKHGLVWPGQEVYVSLTKFIPQAQQSVLDLFERVKSITNNQGANWADSIEKIILRYQSQQDEECFIADLQGLLLGLVLGNLLMGNFVGAISYGLLVSGTNKLLGEKYVTFLHTFIDQFVKIEQEKKEKLEEGQEEAEADGKPGLSKYLKVSQLERERRKLSDQKNAMQYLLKDWTPIFLVTVAEVILNLLKVAPIANFFDLIGASGSQTLILSLTTAVRTALEHTDTAVSRAELTRMGEQAEGNLLKELMEILSDVSRLPITNLDRREDQGLLTTDQKQSILVIKSLGVPTYKSKSGDHRNKIELSDWPVELAAGQILLVTGGEHSGKSTVINTLVGRHQGRPKLSQMTLGDEQIGQAPKKVIEDIFYLIPEENKRNFSARLALVKLARQPNLLGDFSDQVINQLLHAKSGRKIKNNPIIRSFLEYCRKENILQGQDGISDQWFMKLGFTPSGSQQELFNLAIATAIDGKRQPMVMLLDDPTQYFGEEIDQWFEVVEKWLAKSGHRLIIATNYSVLNWLDQQLPISQVLNLESNSVISFPIFDGTTLTKKFEDTKIFEGPPWKFNLEQKISNLFNDSAITDKIDIIQHLVEGNHLSLVECLKCLSELHELTKLVEKKTNGHYLNNRISKTEVWQEAYLDFMRLLLMILNRVEEFSWMNEEETSKKIPDFDDLVAKLEGCFLDAIEDFEIWMSSFGTIFSGSLHLAAINPHLDELSPDFLNLLISYQIFTLSESFKFSNLSSMENLSEIFDFSDQMMKRIVDYDDRLFLNSFRHPFYRFFLLIDSLNAREKMRDRFWKVADEGKLFEIFNDFADLMFFLSLRVSFFGGEFCIKDIIFENKFSKEENELNLVNAIRKSWYMHQSGSK